MSRNALPAEFWADIEAHTGKRDPLDVDNMTEDDIARLRFTNVSEEDAERVEARLEYLKKLRKQ
ncbi:hypothetical protein NHG31_08310 [Aerococcaceae bacterium NML171108]|nr:hypothetical protein [Aerococcaceae bacterium NML171108]